MPKIAYIIAAYGGNRINGNIGPYRSDRAVYVRDHLKQLETVKHNIDTIILVVNSPTVGQEEEAGFKRYIQTLPSTVGNSNLILERRKNIGVSYGAYNHAFKKYHADFDYFILMEDDWLPMEDNFDTTLVKILNDRPETAYLCGYLGWGFGGGDDPHAGISNGIISSSIVRKVLEKGGFPHSNTSGDNYDNGQFGQVAFSQSVLPFGKITDLSDKYRMPYFRVSELQCFAEQNDKIIFAPHQLIKGI